ncbi:MAG: chemotaxis protein CheX [Planctomycetota bacterium]|nr:chemotaxis protein CheX [Planctomycetota bacterium]
MKIAVAAASPTVVNMVRGAMQSIKNANAIVVGIDSPALVKETLANGAALLVDWELNEAIAVSFITAARQANAEAPIIILCPKIRLNTVSAGMEAGANGVVTKPFTGEDIVSALEKARSHASGAKPALNVAFVNPFIAATCNLFRTMCGLEVKRKNLYLKSDYKMFGDISGVMGLSGQANGSVVISLPKALACAMVAKMLGEAAAPDINDSVRDGVAEIINMIAGQAKAALAETKYHFTISLPSVVVGAGHEIMHKKGTPNIVIIFDAGEYEFAVQVCLAAGEESKT